MLRPICKVNGESQNSTPVKSKALTVDGSNDTFSPKDVLLGGQNNESYILGVNLNLNFSAILDHGSNMTPIISKAPI